MLPILEAGEETLVGGQAVMEGVMMRAPHSYCVAVRKPNRELVTSEMPIARMSEQYRIFKYPLLRGLGTLSGSQARREGTEFFRLGFGRGPRKGSAKGPGPRDARLGGRRPGDFLVFVLSVHVQVRPPVSGDTAGQG